MSTTGQGISGTWNERMRLIRLRRKKERPRFREELAVIPRWLVWTCAIAYLLALSIVLTVLLLNPEYISPTELAQRPVLAALALTGATTGIALPIVAFLLSLGYIYRDARRRGMHAGLWTLLVLILSPSFFLVGYIIYFLVREPLPYPCPSCGNLVGPRFNFCPNCKCNLHPSCPSCKREIAETDKFCPYCAQELNAAPGQASVAPQG